MFAGSKITTQNKNFYDLFKVNRFILSYTYSFILTVIWVLLGKTMKFLLFHSKCNPCVSIKSAIVTFAFVVELLVKWSVRFFLNEKDSF